MAATTSPGTPQWTDRRNRRAGFFSGLTGNPKAVAAALGLSERRGRQLRTGEAPGLPQWVLHYLDRLIERSSTSPWPIPAAMVEHIHTREAALLTAEELQARFVRICEDHEVPRGLTRMLRVCLRGRVRHEDLEDVVEFGPRIACALLELSTYARMILDARPAPEAGSC